MAVLPSNLTTVSVGVTAGAANVTTTGTILDAPGAGLRYRLWSLHIGPYSTPQAPGNWMATVTDVPVTRAFGRVARAGFLSADLYWPGGQAWPTNGAVGYQVASALAGLALSVTIGYTVEATY